MIWLPICTTLWCLFLLAVRKKGGKCLDMKSDQNFIHIASTNVFKHFWYKKQLYFVHFLWVLSHDLIANLHNSLMSVFVNCKKKGGECLYLKSDQNFIHIAPAFKTFLIKTCIGSCKKKGGKCLDLKSDQNFIHFALASVFKAF